MFKYSVLRQDADKAVPMWYNLPRHSLEAKPHFNWAEISYDVAFVGKYTNPVRAAAVASIRKQAPELRFFLDVDDGVYIKDGVIFTAQADSKEARRRQNIFLRSMDLSLTILCPPGVGPQSFRMYESMRMGRIPIIFGTNVLYPLEDKVDYDSFCLRISYEQVMDTGIILKNWLGAHSKEDLYSKCILASKTWHKYFSHNKLQTLLHEAGKKFGFATY